MDKRIQISVIIPCYNCEKWIRKCIQALEKQTYKNFEVICIDDCSIDNTYNTLCLIKEATFLNIVLLRNESNLGPAKSRNKAISISQGEYLAFCDADDWYDRFFLELMMNEIEKSHSDLVMCNYRKVFESGKDSEDVVYIKKDYINTKNEAIAYSKASLCLLVFRKDLISDLMIPDLRNGEDIAFIPCVEARATSISVVEQVLYNYWMRSGSSSNQSSESIFESLCSAFKFIEDNSKCNDLEILEYLGIKTVLYGAIMNGLKAGNNLPEIKEVKRIFTHRYPSWYRNRYMFLFSKPKRIFLWLIKENFFVGAKLLAKIHEKVSI